MNKKRKCKSFISLLLVLTLILPDLLNGFNFIYAETKSDSGVETVTLSKTFKNVADGFKKVVVGITSPKEGYIAGMDLSAGFKMDITVDDEYLYNIYDKFKTAAGFPEFQDSTHPDEDINAYNYRIDEFFHNNADMPKMSCDFVIGNDFTIDEVLLDSTIDVKDEDGNHIGMAVFTENDGELSVNITFENQIYNRLDARLGFEQQICLKESSLKSEPVYVGWLNDGFVVNTKEFLEGDTPVEVIPDTITKTGPSYVNDTEVTYNIEVTGKKLNGYTVEDILPLVTGVLNIAPAEQQYLDVIQMKVDGNEVTGFLTQDGKYQYTFPSDGEDITDAEINITVALTEAQKKAFSDLMYASNNDASIQITNKAKLYSDINKAAVAVSQDVNTNIGFKLIDKNCTQDSMNGDRFEWDININTAFNAYNISDAYILDSIDSTAHMYEKKAGVLIVNDGVYTKLPITYLGEASGEYGSNIYDTLSTVLSLETLLTDNGWSISDDSAYYFTYNGQTMMLVPYTGFISKNVTLTYFTNINKENETAISSLKNDVKLVWKYGEGNGPENIKDFNINISKTGNVNKTLGYKKGISYDEYTRRLNWKVAVNYYPEELKNAVVIDELNYDIQRLADNESIKYKVWDRSTRSVIREGNVSEYTEGVSEPYYVLSDGADKLKNLTISVGSLTENEFLEIVITTEVVDKDILGKNTKLSDNKYISNNAVIAADIDGKRETQQIDASQIVTNTLIDKTAVGNYDYKTNEFTWKVKINPNRIPLSGMVITDTLPDGNIYGKLLSVKCISDDETVTDANVSGNNAVFADGTVWNINDNGNTISISSTANTNDTFEFLFTSVVTDAKIKSVLHNGVDKNIALDNTAELSAKYILDGDSYDVSADASASNSFTVKTAYKDGEYQSGENYIPWRVLVNIEHIDMTGVNVIENLPELLELDIDSFKVYKASVNSDGSLDDSSISDENLIPMTELTDALQINSRGFTYTIPDKFSNQPLYFMFDTYFLDDVTAEDVKNVVVLSDGDIDYTTNPSTGKYDDSFELDNYVKTTKKPLLLIKKKSVNSVDSTIGLPLGDAKFTLNTYSKTANGIYKDNGDSKEIISKDSGNGTYVNLKTQTIYELIETKAPSGYIVNQEPQYYVFVTADDSCAANITLQDVSGNVVKKVDLSNIHVFKQDATKGGIYYDEQGDSPIIEYKDTVAATNKIVFKKVGQTDQALPNSVFTLKKQDGVVNNSTNWSAVSNASGEVIFTEVDAGKDSQNKLTYTMTETVTGDKYHDQGATFTVRTWMENNVFKYSIESMDTSLATVDENNALYSVKNVYRKGIVKFKKIDSVTGIGISGIKFDIYDAGTDTKLNAASASSGSEGVVVFDNIPYSSSGYYIKESETATGYKDTLVGTKVITITTDEVEDAITAVENSIDGKKKNAFVIDKSNTESAFVENERITGTVSFTKNDSNGAIHTGREFALVMIDSDAEQYFVNSNPTGTEVVDGNGNTKGEAGSGYLTSNGIVIQTSTSDLDGKVTFSNVPYGNYKLIELTPRVAGDNYSEVINTAVTKSAIASASKKSADGNSFEISLGTIANELLKAPATLIKKNSVTNEVMSNVQFTLTGTDADGKTFSQVRTTNSSGAIYFTNIPVGTYTLAEKAVLGYENPETYVMEVVSEYNRSAKKNNAVVHIYKANYDKITEKWVKTSEELTTESSKYTITNTPRKTSFTFKKKNDAGNSVEGVTFSLYRKKLAGTYETDAAYTAVSDVNGVAAFNNVYYGDYKIVETRPEGYEANSDVTIESSDFNCEYADKGTSEFTFSLETVAAKNNLFTLDAADKMSIIIVNNVIDANFKISKKNQDGNNISAKFEILNDDKDETKTGITLTTNADNGNSDIFNLSYGKYIISETECENVFEDESTEQLLKIYFEVGEKLGVSNQWISEVKVKKVFIAERELSAADAAKYVKLTGNDTAGYTFSLVNDIKYGYLQVNKYLSENDDTENFALAGAKFRVDKISGTDASYYITLTTDENGRFVINSDGSYSGESITGSKINKHFYYGTYRITEISTGRNYVVNNNKSVEVTFGENTGETSDRNTAVISGNASDNTELIVSNNLSKNDTTKKLYNNAARGTFTLKKQSSDNTLLNGAGFIIYRASDNKPVASLVNESNGIYYISGNVADSTSEKYNVKDTDNIPYVYENQLLADSYYIKEYKTNDGYILNDSTNVPFMIANDGTAAFTNINGFATFDEDNKQLTVINNSAKVAVEKIDFVDSAIKISGVELEVFKKNNEGKYPSGGTKYKTDANGLVNIDKIKAGTYKIVENIPKTGYAKASASVEFTIDKYGHITESSTTDGNFISISGNKIVFRNKPNGIIINKAYFNGATKVTENLPEAVFGLYNGETLKYSMTTVNQKALLSKVADGTYSLREITTGNNDIYICDNRLLAEITIEDGKISVSNVETDCVNTAGSTEESLVLDIKNFRKANVEFTKLSNVTNTGLNGVTFTLTDSFGNVQTCVSANGGKVRFENLMPGTYLVNETATVEGYYVTLATVRILVDSVGNVTYTDGNGAPANDLDAIFVNKQTKVVIKKVDENGANVSGVELTVTGSKFADGSDKLVFVTGSEALNIIGKLITGVEYTITETGRKSGYTVAAPVTFMIEKNGIITGVTDNTIEMCDEHISGSIRLIKHIPEEIASTKGITFELYASADNKADESDTLYQDEIALNENGMVTISNLPEGYYYFVEKTTNDSLYLDKTPSEVIHIGTAEHKQTVDVSMNNVKFDYTVMLTKINGYTSEPLKDAEFTLYDNHENEIGKYVTDENGKIFVKITRKGTYTLEETKAPYGFNLAEADDQA